MVHHPDPFVESDRLIAVEKNVAAIAKHLGVLVSPPWGSGMEPDDGDVMAAAAKVGVSPLSVAPVAAGARPARYRKKPVEIEAVEFDSWQDMEDIARWCGGRVRSEAKPSDRTDVRYWIDIPTLEGVMQASMGDWIIRGVKGEYYSCKPDVFAASYEPAEAAR
jgi:hypothetical protein